MSNNEQYQPVDKPTPPPQQPYQDSYQQLFSKQQNYLPPAKNSNYAVISLICGLVGYLGFHGFGACILGVYWGHKGLSEIKKSNGTIGGRGYAIAGLILNYIPIVFVLVLGLIIFLFRLPLVWG